MKSNTMRYWTWTGKVSPSRSKKTVFLPSEAIKNMKIEHADTIHFTLKREEIFFEERSWTWTSAPLTRGKQMAVEIPSKAVEKFQISDDDFLHLEMEIDESGRFWHDINKIRLYGDDSEVFDRNLLEEFIVANNIVDYSRGSAYSTMCGYIGDKTARGQEKDSPPKMDHVSSFRTDKNNRIFVYHPYKNSYFNAEEIEAWGERNGLKSKVYGTKFSWYYPYNTYCVVITEKDFDVKLNETKKSEREIRDAFKIK